MGQPLAFNILILSNMYQSSTILGIHHLPAAKSETPLIAYVLQASAAGVEREEATSAFVFFLPFKSCIQPVEAGNLNKTLFLYHLSKFQS